MNMLPKGMVELIGTQAHQGYQDDLSTRQKWETNNKEIDKLMLQENEAKNYPFPNCSNVKYPLITEAVLQFSARAYPTIINNGNIALMKTIGRDENDAKRARGERVAKDLNFQITEEIDDWDAGMDQLLTALPKDGVTFKKIYRDHVENKTCVDIVFGSDLIVSNTARSLKTCPRISQKMPVYYYEAAERCAIGEFAESVKECFDPDNPADERVFVEQHCLYDCDGDGYPEPYVVTFDAESGMLARIVADYNEASITFDPDTDQIISIRRNLYFVKYECFPSGTGEFYTPGFGSLLLTHNNAINSVLNQLIDAGHLANTQGGFLAREFRVKSGTLRFSPGEYKKTDVPALHLQNSVMPLPVREPSPVLFQLLGVLVDSGKSIASIQEVMTGGAPANQPAATTLALIEQGMKVYSGVFKRIYRALREELRIIYELSREYRSEDQYLAVVDDPGASIEDYAADDLDIKPAADPNMTTDMQKQLRDQALLQLIQVPGANVPLIVQNHLRGLGIDDPKQFFPDPPAPQPTPEDMKLEADMAAQLQELNIKKQEADTKASKAKFDNLKTMIESLEKLGEAAEKGGNLGIGLAEIGVIEKFIQDQKLMLERELANEQPVQQPQGVPGLEREQPIPMGLPNGTMPLE